VLRFPSSPSLQLKSWRLPCPNGWPAGSLPGGGGGGGVSFREDEAQGAFSPAGMTVGATPPSPPPPA